MPPGDSRERHYLDTPINDESAAPQSSLEQEIPEAAPVPASTPVGTVNTDTNALAEPPTTASITAAGPGTDDNAPSAPPDTASTANPIRRFPHQNDGLAPALQKIKAITAPTVPSFFDVLPGIQINTSPVEPRPRRIAFRGAVIIDEWDESIRTAQRAEAQRGYNGTIHVFTGGSTTKRHGSGIGIIWLGYSRRYRELFDRLPDIRNIEPAEAYAIALALRTVLDDYSSSEAVLEAVVFMDSQRTLMAVEGLVEDPFPDFLTAQIREIHKLTDKLVKKEKRVGLRWVKAHMTGKMAVEGNVRADRLAKEARLGRFDNSRRAGSSDTREDSLVRKGNRERQQLRAGQGRASKRKVLPYGNGNVDSDRMASKRTMQKKTGTMTYEDNANDKPNALRDAKEKMTNIKRRNEEE